MIDLERGQIHAALHLFVLPGNDCLTDSDCSGMATPAICDPSIGECRYICDQHTDCSGGICSSTTSMTSTEVMICAPACGIGDSCPSGQVCVGKKYCRSS